MLSTFTGKRILVVVAHPDDELLGLGATIHQLIKQYKCICRAVILGEGLTARSATRDVLEWEAQLVKHRTNIKTAQKSIGYQEVSTYNFPDNRFDSVDLLDIIKVVEKEKEIFQPSIIFTHHGGDVNIDHQRTFEAVITATRPMAEEQVHTIIAFETPSGTEWRAASDPRHFIPNLFFEVSEKDLIAKIQGMEAYEFEKRLYPHPRSPEALKIQAQRWGVVVGKQYAEAFMLIRSINTMRGL